MTPILDHHDGHGLNERIVIEHDEPDLVSGAKHTYRLYIQDEGASNAESMVTKGKRYRLVGTLQFQRGPRDEPGSTPGLTEAAVYAVLIDRLRDFQAGVFSCRENAIQLTKLEEALHWTRHRADARARRGVLGRNEK